MAKVVKVSARTVKDNGETCTKCGTCVCCVPETKPGPWFKVTGSLPKEYDIYCPKCSAKALTKKLQEVGQLAESLKTAIVAASKL